MKTIPLTQGKVALVDDDQHERLRQYSWHAVHTKAGRWYAETEFRPPLVPRRRTIRMHQLVCPAPCGQCVDHIDHDGLHNYRKNLRVCTVNQNRQNQEGRRHRKSQYKCVEYHIRSGRWSAHIGIVGKKVHLGMAATEIEAAGLYDKAARQHFGEFACLNLI